MSTDQYRNNRLVALFALGWVLLGYPLLSLFNQPVILWVVPVLYAYIFLVWALLIVLVSLTVSSRPPS
jgi:hypothetical protein